MVKLVFSVSNLLVAMSIVTPLSLSSVPSSSTQANAKEPLPIRSASFLYFSIVLLSIASRSKRRRPMSVLLPASTCPI